MSNEINYQVALSCYKPSVMANAVGRSFGPSVWNMAGNLVEQGTVIVATTTTAIPLGQVTSPGLAVFFNMDATNYIQLQVSNGGAVLARLVAGGPPAFIPLDPGMTPYAIANTAPCYLDYLILST